MSRIMMTVTDRGGTKLPDYGDQMQMDVMYIKIFYYE